MAENKSIKFTAVKRIVLIFAAAVLAVIISLSVYIMVCGMNGQTAVIFGTSVLRVVSGSMEPSISEGDYIIVRRAEASELKEGDIICFYSKDSSIYGMPNTHRIIRILPNGSFVTKGDANNSEDETPVSPDMIIGKYECKSGLLRFINSFTSVKKLILLAIIILISIAAIYEVRTVAKTVLSSGKENERRKEEEKHRLIREAIDKEKEKLSRLGYHPQDEEKGDNGAEKQGGGKR